MLDRTYKSTLAINQQLAEGSRNPEDHADVARDLNNVATVLWSIDNHNQAAVWYGKQAIEIAEQTFGHDDPITLQYRENWEGGIKL